MPLHPNLTRTVSNFVAAPVCANGMNVCNQPHFLQSYVEVVRVLQSLRGEPLLPEL